MPSTDGAAMAAEDQQARLFDVPAARPDLAPAKRAELDALVAEAERRRAAVNLGFYAERMFPGYHFGAFHKIMFRALERFVREIQAGNRPRLMIFAPPQHGKSTVVSRAFPAWVLGQFPDWPIISASYNATLAGKHARWVRNTLADPQHCDVFERCRLAKDSRERTDWETTLGGGVAARGVGGGTTGLPARIFITDDPIPGPKEAHSLAYREALWDWYDSVATTRLAPAAGEIVMHTRWHMDDLAGRLVAKERGFDVVSLPAIAERDEYYDAETARVAYEPGPRRKLVRRKGAALHPDRYSLERLEEIRRDSDEWTWAALYQQRPIAEGGQIFRRDWWKFYDAEELPDAATCRRIDSWDTAAKRNADSDTTARVTFYVSDDRIYIVDFVSEKLEFPDLKRAVIAAHDRRKTGEVLVEDASSGIGLCQELKRETRVPIVAMKPLDGMNKVLRAKAATPLIENGQVLLPRSAPWLDRFLEYVTAFPGHPVRDPVDALTQGLNYINFHAAPAQAATRRDELTGALERQESAWTEDDLLEASYEGFV